MHLTERKGPLNRLRKTKYKKIFQGQSATLEMALTFYNINLRKGLQPCRLSHSMLPTKSWLGSISGSINECNITYPIFPSHLFYVRFLNISSVVKRS